MIYQTVMVDPQKAKQWLLKNTKNRKLQQRHVERLAQEMLNGKWVLNGQTISFSNDGALLDGQHRLYAVIKSGVTVPMSVAFGVDNPNAFKTYDINVLKRGVDQIALMMGIENATHASAIARRLLHWDNAEDKTTFSLTTETYQRLPGDEVLEYLQSHNNEIQTMLKDMRPSLPYRKCSAGSAFIAALIICNRTDEVATLLFNEGLKTGAGYQANSPIHLLRERLIDPPSKRGVKWEVEVMALTIKAWNKFLSGKTIKFLRWRQEGDCPEKFPIPGDK